MFAFSPSRPSGYDPGMAEHGGPLYWLKRRSRRFWIVVAVMLPVFYVVSFGPACWISSRAQPSGYIVSIIYRPLIQAWWHLPPSIERPVSDYLCLGISGSYIEFYPHSNYIHFRK